VRNVIIFSASVILLESVWPCYIEEICFNLIFVSETAIEALLFT